MADAEAVCAGLPQRADVRYTGLILNERGYRRLRETCLDEAGLVVPVSDTFGERNQGQSVSDAVAMAREVIRDGKLTGYPVQVTLAVAFGCPFQGHVPMSDVLAAAESLLEAGPVEIALADTIGVGVPWQVQQTFTKLKSLAGDVPMRAHFHDTRNTGIANAYASLLAGVATLDASIGGIGGCPFAPNASGNIATEDLVYMLNRCEVHHDLEMAALLAGAAWLEPVLGKKLPSTLLKAGDWPGDLSADA
jgi:hydroxymethylglutaryl-CoA lyase